MQLMLCGVKISREFLFHVFFFLVFVTSSDDIVIFLQFLRVKMFQGPVNCLNCLMQVTLNI